MRAIATRQSEEKKRQKKRKAFRHGNIMLPATEVLLEIMYCELDAELMYKSSTLR